MGIAAYNRGTLLIREQFDREAEAVRNNDTTGWQNLADRRADVIVSQAAELAKARRLIALLRAEKACLREEIAGVAATTLQWKQRAVAANQAAGRFRRSWHKASALLRLLPASKVHELRGTK